MNICLVTQEIGKIPSGVVSVISQLASEWKEDDKLFILMNKHHWAYETLSADFQNNPQVSLKLLPFLLLSERFFLLSNRIKNTHFLLLVKILTRSFRWLEMLVVSIWVKFWLQKESIHTVISHNGGWPGGELNRWSIWSSWLSRVPCSYLVIHNLPWNPPFFFRPFDLVRNRLIESVSNGVITVSDSCAKSLKSGAYFKTVPGVIYNGIALPSNAKIHKDSVINKELTRIAFIGEIHPRKGVDILINALSYISKPCELILVGSGDQNYIEELSLLSKQQKWKTKNMGFSSNVEQYYLSCDIVVLPSVEFESFGMTLIEAMCYSLPVVCSDFGGMKEVVEDGVNGYVVPARNPALLGLKLNSLVNNPELRRRMGVAGRKRVLRKFTADSMVKKYQSLCHIDE